MVAACVVRGMEECSSKAAGALRTPHPCALCLLLTYPVHAAALLCPQFDAATADTYAGEYQQCDTNAQLHMLSVHWVGLGWVGGWRQH